MLEPPQLSQREGAGVLVLTFLTLHLSTDFPLKTRWLRTSVWSISLFCADFSPTEDLLVQHRGHSGGTAISLPQVHEVPDGPNNSQRCDNRQARTHLWCRPSSRLAWQLDSCDISQDYDNVTITHHTGQGASNAHVFVHVEPLHGAASIPWGSYGWGLGVCWLASLRVWLTYCSSEGSWKCLPFTKQFPIPAPQTYPWHEQSVGLAKRTPQGDVCGNGRSLCSASGQRCVQAVQGKKYHDDFNWHG